MTYAGAVGQIQGFIAFVKNNPEAYSHEQQLDELFKLNGAINDKLATVEVVGEQQLVRIFKYNKNLKNTKK